MVEIGMDVDRVREIASALDQQVSALASTIASVDNTVATAEQVWVGKDAQDFAGWWQQKHRPAMLRSQDAIAGLVRSARNNAAEQEATSASSGGTDNSGVGPGLVGASAFAAAMASGASGFLAWARQHTSSSAHVGEGGFSSQVFTGIHGERSGHHSFGDNGAADGSVSGFVGTRADGGAHWGRNGYSWDADAAAHAYLGAGGVATGSVAYGVLAATGQVSGFVGARADLDGHAHVGPDGASVAAGGRAFAGAEASANASVHAAGVGGTGSVSGWAGVGVEAHADAHLTASEIKVQAKLGAALGYGGAVSVGVDIKPDEVARNLQRGIYGFFH